MARRSSLTWQVGDVVVRRIEESVLPVSRATLVPDITDAQIAANWSWLHPYFDADHRLLLSFHSFLIETTEATIVVDTCVGTDPPRNAPGDASFPDRLDDEIDGGLEAVDVVLCTHLHFDHVGWNTRVVDGRRTPTFANARYLFSRDELEHLDAHDDPHDLAEPAVRPLLDADLVELIDLDHRITPEVRTIPTPGHSPGHVAVVIESAGARALITGDTLHCPLQFRHPELTASRFDWDTDTATTTRRQLVGDLVDQDILVLGTHFAPPTAGYVLRDEAGSIWFGDRP